MTVISIAPKIDATGPEQVAQAGPNGPNIPAPPRGSKMPSPGIDPDELEKLLGGVRGEVNGLAKEEAEENRRDMYKQFGVSPEKIPDADK